MIQQKIQQYLSNLIASMNKELLISEKNKLLKQELVKTKVQDLFFQQRDNYFIDQLKYQLLDELIFHSQDNHKSKILSLVSESYKQYLTSILTFSSDILQHANEFQILSLAHRHNISQSPLLALTLAKKQKCKKVSLIIHHSQISRICRMFANDQEVDTISFVKCALHQQGITVVNLDKQSLQKLQIGDKDIVIIDLFGLDPTQYYLHLQQSYKKLKKSSNIFFYYSNQQELDFQQLLEAIFQLNGFVQSLRLSLIPPYPIQINCCEQQPQLLKVIFDFVQSISRYSEKQDIILFYPLDEPLYKFMRRIKEQILKISLKDSINLITTSNQTLSKQKSNIFLVKNDRHLRSWNYDYSNVFMVVDYGFQQNFLFDYEMGCYVEQVTRVTSTEKIKRMMWIGSDRCGKYYYLADQTILSSTFWDSCSDISGYIVNAIHHNQLHLVDLTHQRVIKCLRFLIQTGIIQSNTQNTQNTYRVVDERLVEYVEKGVAPIEAKLMLSVADDTQLLDKHKQKYLNLMAIVVAVVGSQGSLRKVKQEMQGSHIKPYAVWRKSGYIESCIQIITKCELIESRKQPHNSKSQDFRRKTSKSLEGNFEMFEKHQTKKRKKFEDRDVTDLIADYTVNEELLHILRDRVQDLRDIFQFQSLPILVQKENINNIFKYCLEACPKANIGVFTGSKTTEYFNGKENIFLHQACLFHVLNQRPQFIKIIRMSEIDGVRKITMANSIQKEAYIDKFGKIPAFQRIVSNSQEKIQQKQDKPQVQVAKQFKIENISSAVLQELVKDNGKTVEKFEQQNNCHLNINMQLGNLSIICFKDEFQNKNYVNENLNILMNKTIELCKFYTKRLHYMGILNFILCQGGKILQITDSNHTTRCLFKNLPVDIAKQYVQVILQDYNLKNVQIIEPDQYNEKPSAIVQFYSKKTYQQFIIDYNRNMAQQNFFKVQPLKEADYLNLKQKQQNLAEFGQGSSFLIFKWFTWKSHGTAQVKFRSPQAVTATLEAFQINPLLDYAKIQVTPDPKNKYIINIQNLDVHTDQIYIEQALSNYGEIQSVQVLKTPLKETSGDSVHIGYLLKKALDRKYPLAYKVLQEEKKQYGLRTAKIAIQEQNYINHICENLNRQTNLMGEGRLYVEPMHERMILIPEGCIEIYTQLFEELLESLKKEKPKIKTQLRQDDQNIYLVLMSPIQQTLLFMLASLKEKLGGVKVDFPFEAKNVIMNEIGLANFLDMQEKYNCKFVISVYSSKIRVLAKRGYLQAIAKQVQDRLNNHFFYKVALTSKNYKLYRTQPQLLQQLQTKFDLKLAQLEEDSFSLLLEGSATTIKSALQWIHDKGKNQNKPIEERNGISCGICCQKSQDSYRLFCQHRFCRQCLLDYLRYSLGDMSMFPLRCPDSKCRKFISCIDLQHLFEHIDWHKIRTITANEFLKTNDNYSYCMTPGCEQINLLRKDTVDSIYAEFMRCDICKNSYCLKCNQIYHPARTCTEAKVSEDQMLKKYISQQGVRKCVGKKCKALVMRYTGCFKVQCSRCSICMCFKCPPDQMEGYKDAQQCYEHLNAVHGGYY